MGDSPQSSACELVTHVTDHSKYNTLADRIQHTARSQPDAYRRIISNADCDAKDDGCEPIEKLRKFVSSPHRCWTIITNLATSHQREEEPKTVPTEPKPAVVKSKSEVNNIVTPNNIMFLGVGLCCVWLITINVMIVCLLLLKS